ncbi:hypothetical protein F5X68DRAFT_13311 [Plectosphaerella plurivora]|uniref:Uncharacterized protein n=1 Tax=Plectosphaerella plurivora TaxID=936078 RepID=A0A9P8VBI7_9PEZI|nr:hypothetical protein F5X68DRAFT_13311 [Plectosphaerella plurivora]
MGWMLLDGSKPQVLSRGGRSLYTRLPLGTGRPVYLHFCVRHLFLGFRGRQGEAMRWGWGFCRCPRRRSVFWSLGRLVAGSACVVSLLLFGLPWSFENLNFKSVNRQERSGRGDSSYGLPSGNHPREKRARQGDRGPLPVAHHAENKKKMEKPGLHLSYRKNAQPFDTDRGVVKVDSSWACQGGRTLMPRGRAGARHCSYNCSQRQSGPGWGAGEQDGRWHPHRACCALSASLKAYRNILYSKGRHWVLLCLTSWARMTGRKTNLSSSSPFDLFEGYRAGCSDLIPNRPIASTSSETDPDMMAPGRVHVRPRTHRSALGTQSKYRLRRRATYSATRSVFTRSPVHRRIDEPFTRGRLQINERNINILG